MKRFIKLVSVLLTLTLLLGGLSVGGASIGAPGNSGARTGGRPPEFVAAAVNIIQENWQDDYFSAITMTIGEDRLMIDGQETNSAPAIIENGELLLPVADIAEAIGAAAASRVSERGREETRNQSVDSFTTRRETEKALGVSVRREGDFITITKPYQTKELIVRTKDGTKLPDTFGAIAEAYDGEGLYLLQYETEEGAQNAHGQLKMADYVRYAEPNGVVTVNEAVSDVSGEVLAERWGSERIAADRFKDYLADNGKTDAEILVAVVDTGADATHPFLQNRIRADLGYNFVYNNKNANDDHYHGTHVSGTITDCTPGNVGIIPVKVLNAGGYGTTLQVSLGIEYAADMGAKVINLSLGGIKSEEDSIEQDAVDYAVNLGTTCIVAAGNDNADASNYAPAGLDNVITVSAIDFDDTRAWFSNWGEGTIDIAAPGVDIFSCIPGGGYEYLDGTSMAAPHVTAAVAMLKLDAPTATPEQLKQALRDTAFGGNPKDFGAGILEFNIFFDCQPLPEPPGVKLNRHSIVAGTMLEKYSTYQLKTRITPLPNSVAAFYTSDNPEVATVSGFGVVTILNNGVANITASIVGGLSDTCTVFSDVDESAFWIGYAADSFAGGDGTKNYPYQIGTPEQLALMSRNARLELKGGGLNDEYFELIADIDLAGKEWISIGCASGSGGIYFITGTIRHFDGNGFMIMNMQQGHIFSGLAFAEHGLFSLLWDGGEVRDLGLVYADQENPHDGFSPGILSNNAYNSTIIKCFTTGKTVGSGLVDQATESVIENCYSTAETKRGFVYQCNGSSIRNCYASGNSYFIYDVHMFWYRIVYPTGETFDYENKSSITNSFLINDNPNPEGFIIEKSDSVIRKCYSYNNIPLSKDDDPDTTEIIYKPVEFFKDVANFMNSENWDDEDPWDFDTVWAIDADYNEGLPFLIRFGSETDVGKVAAAKASITWESIKGRNNLPSDVRYDLGPLPTSHIFGATISWWSSNPAVVSNNGVVTRPKNTEGDENASLIATIQSGDVSDTIVFDLTIKEISLVSMDKPLVAAGSYHSMAVKTDGSLWTWGNNHLGPLGDGTVTNRLEPVEIIDDVASVAASDYHTLAIKADGSLWAWGDNYDGQLLGDGTSLNRLEPAKILDDVVSVATGNSYTLAVKTDGSLWAWGDNRYGQLGDGTTTNRLVPVKIMDGVGSVATGYSYTLAVKTDGSLWAWGNNDSGQLGDGTQTSHLAPVKIMDGVESVAAGGVLTLALKTDGSLWAWGYFSYTMGDGMTHSSFTPIKIMDGVENIAAGNYHTLVVKADGSLWAWGYNNYGQLGDGTTTSSTTPLKVMDGVAIAAAGNNHTLAVKTDGSLWAWGYNYYGQLGDGTTTDSPIPIKIMPAGSILPYDDPEIDAEKVAAAKASITWDSIKGYNDLPSSVRYDLGPLPTKHTYGATITWSSSDTAVVNNTGTVRRPSPSTGDKDVTLTATIQLGDAWDTVVFSLTVKEIVLASRDATVVAAGSNYTMAVKTDGSLWAWGFLLPTIGNETFYSSFTPIKIIDGVESIAAEDDHTLMVKADGSLWAWGLNSCGQLGDGTTTNRWEPVKIMEDVASVSAADYHTLAVKTDGSLWAWGDNSKGQLGDGTSTDSLTPLKIMYDVASVAAGNYHTLAVKTDGSLWAWGWNIFGQLGNGTTTDSPTPLKIMDDVASVAAGNYHTLAVKTDGSLWAWGNNSYGVFGDGTMTGSLTPLKIMDDVASVATRSGQTLAVKTDGSLWAWGHNDYGQLGDGTMTDSLTPLKIMDDVASVATRSGHTLAVKTDGSLWAWGYNYFGQLGDGTTTDSHSPIQIMPAGSILPYEPGGISVSGTIKTYNPKNAAIIRLTQGGEAVYEITPEPTTASSYGQMEQPFTIENVLPGSYDLVITKPGHASFTVKNIIVGDEDVDLTQDARAAVRLMTLRCGDINGDGMINDADLTVLWRAVNYDKPVEEAANPLCDLNGDGYINDVDLTILWMTYNYNRSGIVIES